MPKREDIQRVLLLGSGPIVIGQACEFDYSGTQAVRALREEGYRVVLVNSNPATIMTDPDLADATYIEPLTPEWVERVIERERPDALLPTMGGQVGLNVSLELHDSGILEKYGVELIGADARAIRLAEDREQFAGAMRRESSETPPISGSGPTSASGWISACFRRVDNLISRDLIPPSFRRPQPASSVAGSRSRHWRPSRPPPASGWRRSQGPRP